MRAFLSVALVALSAATLATGLGADEREELRRILTEALAEPDPTARQRILLRTKAGDSAFTELVAAIREGPVYEKDALEPRRVAGREEELTHHGRTIIGFTFESDAGLYRYAVDVPPSYDAKRPHAVLVDPGHGSAKDDTDEVRVDMLGMYRRHAAAARLSDWLVVRTEIIEAVGTDGRREELAEDRVGVVFQDLFRDLASRLHIDPNRIYATGLSQTGYWSWYLGRFRADRWAGIAPMSAVTKPCADSYLENFLALPAYVLHGERDTTCEVDQVRATCARLALLGAPIEYREIAGGGHEYAVWGEQPAALAWLAERPRDPYPRRVSKSLQTALDGWCYWLRVDELEREGDGRDVHPPTAGVDAELDGQTVRIFSEGVKRLTLCLSSEMLDLDRPIEVVWNEKRVHAGSIERDLRQMLALATEKVDWKGTFEAALELGR